MDLENEFKKVEVDKDLESDVLKIRAKENLENTNLPEKLEDFSEGDRIIKELEERLRQIKSEEEEYIDEELAPTMYENFKPYILPIVITFFSILIALLLLYIFSLNRTDRSISAIVNSGNYDQIFYPPAPTEIIIKETPLECVPPQYLNETGDACLDPEPEPEPEKIGFENGTTTIANVRFSFDKFNYDNYPRGIYMLDEQIFEGDYLNYKIAPTNRAFANDHFFGVDRYTVSLIGDCQFVVDEAKILVKDMYERNKYFTGNVIKVISASKPRVVCGK